jgi:hypothetical protein
VPGRLPARGILLVNGPAPDPYSPRYVDDHVQRCWFFLVGFGAVFPPRLSCSSKVKAAQEILSFRRANPAAPR